MDSLCLHSQVVMPLSSDMTPARVSKAVEAQGPISMATLNSVDSGHVGTDVRQAEESCKNGHTTIVEETTHGVADALCITVSREYVVGGDDGSDAVRIPASGLKVVGVDSNVVGGRAYRLISFVMHDGSGAQGHYLTCSLRRASHGKQGRVKGVCFRCDDGSATQVKQVHAFNEAQALAGTYMYIR